MPNEAVFNTQSMPLYSLLTNTYLSPGIQTPLAAAAAAQGVSFRLTTGTTNIGNGQNLNLQITNPSGSGKTLYINQVTGGSSANASISLLSGATLTGGSTPTAINSNLGSATASIATTRQLSGTHTGTPTALLTSAITAGLFVLDFAGSIVVPPNQSFTAVLGPGVITCSINLNWWEL